MSDQLDDRIRAAVLEVVDSGPVAPPFEDIESGLLEPVVRRRVTRRALVMAAIAACVAVALVIGGSLVLSESDDSQSVQSPAGQPRVGAVGGCAGKAYVANSGDGTVSVITTATGVVSATITVGSTPRVVAITPDGTHAYVAEQR